MGAEFLLIGLGEAWLDLNLILKVFVLITIVSFVRNHLGNSWLSWIVILGFAWFVLFDGWRLFGPIYILYLLIGMGISGILVDFFFVTAGGMGGGGKEGEKYSPISSGADLLAKRVISGRVGKQMQRPRPPMPG